ncbi:MAG: hypothetical protein ABIH26_12975 [Candidatus Eisenbacteria bacterium]
MTLLRVLSRHEVDYIVIGGVSAVLQGAPVSTFDLDIIHSRSPENVERLLAALEELGAYYREHETRRPVPEARHLQGGGHHLLMTRSGPLDLLGVVSGGRAYEDLEGNAVTMEIEPDLRVRVLNLAMLIVLKEEMGREKDLAVLPVLRRALLESEGRGGDH